MPFMAMTETFQLSSSRSVLSRSIVERPHLDNSVTRIASICLAFDLSSPHGRMLAGGIDHHDVEPAKTIDRPLHHVPAPGLVLDVPRQSESPATLRFDQGDHLFRVSLLIGQITDSDIGALAGIGDRGRAADAGVATSDERLPASQAPRSLVALLAMVWFRIHLPSQPRGRLGLLRKGRAGIYGPPLCTKSTHPTVRIFRATALLGNNRALSTEDGFQPGG